MATIADRKERLTSLAGVALLHLLLGWALLLSLAPALVQSVSEPLGVFTVRQAPPPPPFEEPEVKVKVQPEPGPAPKEPAGALAAPAPVRQAPPVVAPKRVVEHRVNPAVAAGLIPSSGGDSAGVAAPSASGTGGSGSGSGTGTSGSGSGGGGTGGSGAAVVRTKLRSGSIVPRDYPRAAGGAQGTVQARLTVGPSGAVTGCRVTRSSGNAVLDATTCRLIRERFRFTPARDAQGNAVADVHGWQQRWWRD